MSYGSLDDLFDFADIGIVEYTDYETVILDCTIRQTGTRVLVEGDDLYDAVERALAQVEDHVFTVNAILDDYGLTLPELRAMVDFTPPIITEPIEQRPLQIVAAAQPFLATDGEDRLYLALEVLGPENE